MSPEPRPDAQAATPPAQGATPGKKKIKVTRVENGIDFEEEIEVDDVGGLAWPPPEEVELLGGDLKRVDAPLKVTGRARYAHDVRLPGMLWARVLACPLPAAKVELDLEPARAVPGVVAAIALEVPGGATRWLGQPVAAVAARTPEAAEDGLRAIRARFDKQPFAVDHAQATAEGAPKITRDGAIGKENQSGDAAAAEKALEGAAVRVEATYVLPVQHHACLETHGVVVDLRGDEATVYASSQDTSSLPGEAAKALGLPQSKVTAIVEHMGGGFGSKFGLGLEGLAACLLAKETGQPVHLLYTRPAEFLAAGNRSGSVQRMRGGASSDGKLLALVAEVDKLGGIARGSFPDSRPYVYAFAAHSIRSRPVHTNTDGSRAMRAPGHPQASFGIESLVDELAYALGRDPLEVRIANLADPVYERQLRRVAREIGWDAHPNKTAPAELADGYGVGIGFAVATWGGGGRPGNEVTVTIEPDGSVVALSGSQDLGTGTRTYLAAIVAEELGLPLEAVAARLGDSRLGSATGSGGSTTTASLAPAVLDAARNARLALAARVGPELGIAPEKLRFAGGRVSDSGDPSRSFAWKQACAALGRERVTARGSFQDALASSGVHGAQAAKVRVDTLTGRVEVLEMVGLHDCGMPLNQLALRSQIQGGMVQALSYGLLEERVIDPVLGLALNANLEDYKIAGSLEIPKMRAIVDDGDQRRAVIGMSEAAIIPGHSAIANAVYNACGARVRSLPLTADKVLAALGKVV